MNHEQIEMLSRACSKSYKDGILGWKKYNLGEGLVFFVRVINDNAYVVVRGTDEPKDWKCTNFKVGYRKVRDGKAHEGFYDAAMKVVSVVRMLECEFISFAGHSMGGAVALLSAYIAGRSGMRVGGVLTLGAPRCVNRRLARYMDRSIPVHIRVVNENDIVPRLPLPIRFRHCGLLLFLHGDTHTWTPSGWSVFVRRILNWSPGHTIRVHNVANYHQRITNYLKGKER